MDDYLKKDSFHEPGESVKSNMSVDLHVLLDQCHWENNHLRSDNEALRNSLSALELSNRTLNENLLAKQFEIRQLELQLEELRMLYQDSVSARREYDRYLDTVGQVYSVACESADSIVKRAEKSAQEILNDLEKKTSLARESAEKSVMTVKTMRDRLAGSLSGLMENIQHAYREVNEFLSLAESVPQSFEDMLLSQNQILKDIQSEMDSYMKRSRQIIADSERADEDSETAASAAVPDKPKADEYIPSVLSPGLPASEQPKTEPEDLLKLMEQERFRSKQETEAWAQIKQEAAAAVPSAEREPTAQKPEPIPVKETDDPPKSNPAAPQPEQPAIPQRRRTNVKDLLEKYRNS